MSCRLDIARIAVASGARSRSMRAPARPGSRDGIIHYAEVNPDYTRRPDPSALLRVLDGLKARNAARVDAGVMTVSRSSMDDTR